MNAPARTQTQRPQGKPREGDENLAIGNIFGHGFNADKVSELERAGFAIRPQVSHYAGSQIMRFIDFERGPPLEFIEVANEQAYRDFVPKGMEPYCPGISLLVPEGSTRTLAVFEEQFARLQPYRLHVNYDGTNDPGKPGWNYLNFGIPVVRGVFIWLTQLDQPRPVTTHRVNHPNRATGIRGLAFDLEDAELKRLSELVVDDFVDGAVRIAGLTVWSKRAAGLPPSSVDKRFPLHAIVLDVGRADTRGVRADKAARGPLEPDSAVRVKTGPMSWDLILAPPRPGEETEGSDADSVPRERDDR